MNGNKFATGEILRKPVEVVKGRILAGGAQKSPEPCFMVASPTDVIYKQIFLEFSRVMN
jgi:hypothetical protein